VGLGLGSYLAGGPAPPTEAVVRLAGGNSAGTPGGSSRLRRSSNTNRPTQTLKQRPNDTRNPRGN
jgi:hypothetical protein